MISFINSKGNNYHFKKINKQRESDKTIQRK